MMRKRLLLARCVDSDAEIRPDTPYRKDITEQTRNEPDPRSRLKLIAIREATHRVVVHVNSECDVLRGLGDRDKLYLVGHSEAAVDGILYRFGDGHSLMTPRAIAEALKDAELGAGFRDLRLFVCEGACPPPGGGASTAERLVLALVSLGFRNVELSAYRGNIGIWDASGNAFEDGKHHNAVWLGDTRIRASDVRQTFRYHPAADHLSPR